MDERQTRWLLLAVLVSLLALIAAQVPAAEGAPGTSFLEMVGLRVVAPLARTMSASAELVHEFRLGLRSRGALTLENKELRGQLQNLRFELSRLRGRDREAARLADALDFVRRADGRYRPGEIVYLRQTSWLSTLVLYVGGERVAIDQPVVTAGGLVGRVILVSGPYARVQLITDPAAGIGVMLERTRRQGVAQGAGEALLALDYVPLSADVQVGDRVVTAGIDGVYPPGLEVGEVVEVEPGNDLFHHVTVKPAVDFSGLEDLYVLDQAAVPEELVTEGPGGGG